jgi:hypothetical protein
MRKVLSVVAGGALLVMLSAPAAQAAAPDRYRVQHFHHHGLVTRLIEDIIDWL